MPSQMVLSTATNPLTAVLAETPGLNPAERAVERFAINGNAIITGGAGDLGLATCRALLEHGLKGLCIFDIASRLETSRNIIQSFRDEFPSIKIFEEEVDVRDEQRIQEATETAVRSLGSVDILVCYAGIARGSPASEMSLEQWKEVLDINTTGSFLTSKHVAQQMIKQGTGGSIVLVASVAGHRVLLPLFQTAYNVSKAGVLGLKSCLAAEWAQYGIRVNSLSPGFINTVMTQTEGAGPGVKAWTARTPLGRMGEPSELIGPVVMLCSRAGRYITGADIVVDGAGLVF